MSTNNPSIDAKYLNRMVTLNNLIKQCFDKDPITGKRTAKAKAAFNRLSIMYQLSRHKLLRLSSGENFYRPIADARRYKTLYEYI